MESSLVFRAWNKSGRGAPMQKAEIISIEIRAIYVDIKFLSNFRLVPNYYKLYSIVLSHHATPVDSIMFPGHATATLLIGSNVGAIECVPRTLTGQETVAIEPREWGNYNNIG